MNNILRPKISASMMCASLLQIPDYLDIFSNTIDYLHIDIMDGHFVPNIVLGTDYLRDLRSITNLPMDIHLMIERPETKLDWFEISPNDIVTIHYESTNAPVTSLRKIRDEIGAKAFLALNPATPLHNAKYLLDYVDGITVMTIDPGFAGKKLLKPTINKVNELRHYLDENGYKNCEIEVDGNISFDNAKIMRENGANIFVAGTSSLFIKGATKEKLIDAVSKLKEVII